MRPIKYVYLHREGEIVVYVGCGIGDRFNFIWNRSKEHKEWMRDKIDVYWEIIACSTDIAAENLERELIDKYKPKFNCHHTGRLSNKQADQISKAITSRIANGLNAEVCSDRVKFLNSNRFTCPNCGQEGGETAMVRWHGRLGEHCRK